MHILYVDMSGNLGNPNDQHFVMAGISVKETAIYHLIRQLDRIIEQSGLDIPPETELHGVEILRGKKVWRKIPVEKRVAFFKECLSVFKGQTLNSLRAFGVIIDRGAEGEFEPGEYSYEQICSRFNMYLQRLYNRSSRKNKYKHRGLIVVDESKYETMFQNLAAEYRVNGTRWGSLQNLAEVPFFAPSHTSRLIQLADLVSYSLWQKFERDDGQYLSCIAGHFDYDGPTVHGIHHRTAKGSTCDCPGCISRNGFKF